MMYDMMYLYLYLYLYIYVAILLLYFIKYTFVEEGRRAN